MKFRKGALTMMRSRNIAGNIFTKFGNTIIGDITLVDYDDDATKL